MSNYQYAPDEYIIVGKDNIDKVYSIIQYLPLETQMKIIFAWLASEGNKSELIYDQFDNDDDKSGIFLYKAPSNTLSQTGTFYAIDNDNNIIEEVNLSNLDYFYKRIKYIPKKE